MIIGITGGTGCGKTTALDAVRKLGGTVIDCDAVYHRLLQTDKKMLAAIEARFPGVVEDGQLNRKKLGAIVFADEAALLDALNSGKLRGAGLDVWFEEPTPNHDLYCHPAVSCTPHIGAQTVEAQKRIGAEVVDIISGFAF